MKKLTLIIICILLTCIQINAQIFATFEPVYKRFGIVNSNFFRKFGVYEHVRYGDITVKTVQNDFHTKNIKIGVGLTFPIIIEETNTYFYIGINHNYFYDYVRTYSLGNINNVVRTSFDLGISSNLTKKIYFLFISDIWNWDSSIGIGYKFFKTKKRRYVRK